MKNQNKLGKYEKGVILTGIVVLIIFLILLTTDGIKNIGKNNNSTALSEQGTAVPPNAPALSAGMITVKYDGNNLVICKNDDDWYNYVQGKPAYIMLNDGVYQSELAENMTGKKLARENIGQAVEKEEQGSIYVWIPRFAKNKETGEIKHLRQDEMVAGNYNQSTVFTHTTKTMDFALAGIWIEKEPLESSSMVDTKVISMNKEDNIYGLIANVQPSAMTTGASDAMINYITNNLETDGYVSQITDITNMNRTFLKVMETNKIEPIKAKIEYNREEVIVKIPITYTKCGIQRIVNEEKKEIVFKNENGIIVANIEKDGLKAGKNKFTIVDNLNNQKELEIKVTLPIYATLYTDGTLAFTATDKVIEGKTINTKYGDITTQSFSDVKSPWYSVKTSIKTVDIVDKIAPTSTAYWFNECSSITQINNIANLDTSNVVSMAYMFRSCSSLTSLDLSSFDTSNVVDMSIMFQSCSKLTSLNVSSFNTSKVTTMAGMFQSCQALTYLNITNFDTSNVKQMGYMFNWCTSLTSLNLISFDIKSVTNMSKMFGNATKLNKIYVSSNWVIQQEANISDMFYRCPAGGVTVL